MSDIEKYIITRWLYSIGEEPIMSDTEYANLHSYLRAKKLIPEYTERAWSSDPCPSELLDKYSLSEYKYNIKLLDKTESMESLTNEGIVRQRYLSKTEVHTVAFKLDGWNVQLTYFNGEIVKATTRGRESDALNLDNLKKFLPSKINKMGEVKVVGELLLSNESFVRLKNLFPNKEMKSQRVSVRTALANESATHLLTFLAFDIISNDKEMSAALTYFCLHEWGFNTPKYFIARNGEEILQNIKRLSDIEKTYEFLTDGVVVRSNLGRDTRAVRIYAWEENIYHSYITGLEETQSSQEFGCKLLIYPIRTIHGTQQRVSITNLARIQENNLYVGSPIAFGLRSDAYADPNLDVTRYLQELWKDHYESYKEHIIIQEAAKQEKILQERESINYDNLRSGNS